MLIRGFSKHTSYTCANCHSKCCATEFNLPLCGSEKDILSKKYPEYQYYFQSIENGDNLIRGDSCPFLTNMGKCQLHSSSLKPITCLIYPLFFWRFNEKDTLVSIHPCRGKGFQWYSGKKANITNSYIKQLLVKANNYFDIYWGEKIDRNNPYVNVPTIRIQNQIKFYQHTSESELLEKMVRNITLSSFSQIFPSGFETYIERIKDEEVGAFLNSVLNWLIWSPVGLQLSIRNAQLIFSIAALWLITETNFDLEFEKSPLNDPNYINQLSSFYARCILPSFWFNISTRTNNKALISLSSKIYLVLRGELPQEDLSQFYTYSN
ncbi:MAG: hypothetical protein ACW99Q_29870 [Candidatus Kariarchaeaceae archaeon]|jgi:Fe-S-cluster containining protein